MRIDESNELRGRVCGVLRKAQLPKDNLEVKIREKRSKEYSFDENDEKLSEIKFRHRW